MRQRSLADEESNDLKRIKKVSLLSNNIKIIYSIKNCENIGSKVIKILKFRLMLTKCLFLTKIKLKKFMQRIAL